MAHANLSWVVLLCVAVSCGNEANGGATGSPDASAGGMAPVREDGEAPGSGGASGENGEALFASLCAPCHGAAAEGTALGNELRHPVRPYAEWVVRNGRPGEEFDDSAMVAVGPDVLSDAELQKIFDYLDSFRQPADGEGLFLDYCRNCHGSDARGGVVHKDISDKDFNDALEKVRQGSGGQNYGARTRYMPAFGADVLSDEEVRAITEHIATL